MRSSLIDGQKILLALDRVAGVDRTDGAENQAVADIVEASIYQYLPYPHSRQSHGVLGVCVLDRGIRFVNSEQITGAQPIPYAQIHDDRVILGGDTLLGQQADNGATQRRIGTYRVK